MIIISSQFIETSLIICCHNLFSYKLGIKVNPSENIFLLFSRINLQKLCYDNIVSQLNEISQVE